MRKLLPVLLLLTACSYNPGAPDEVTRSAALKLVTCQTETLACFYSTGWARVNQQAVHVTLVSQDLPTPGYLNRWHYIVAPGHVLDQWIGSKMHTTNCGGAVVWSNGTGGMWQEVPGAWRLEFYPTDPAIAAQLAAIAPASECREQTWTVNVLTDGSREIYIEEPDPSNSGPFLQRWQAEVLRETHDRGLVP